MISWHTEQYSSGTNSRKSLHVTNVLLSNSLSGKEVMIPVYTGIFCTWHIWITTCPTGRATSAMSFFTTTPKVMVRLPSVMCTVLPVLRNVCRFLKHSLRMVWTGQGVHSMRSVGSLMHPSNRWRMWCIGIVFHLILTYRNVHDLPGCKRN